MTKSLLICLFALILLSSCYYSDKEEAKKLNSLGLWYIDNGDAIKALAFFIKASQFKNISNSDRTFYFENVANAYIKTQLIDSARYFYFKAASLNSRHSYYYLTNIAQIYLIDRKVDSALNYLEEALDTDSSKPIVNNLLGLIYMGSYGHDYYNPEKAIIYNRKTSFFSNDASSKFVLAQNEYLINNVAESLKILYELHDEVPDYEPYLVSLILIEGERNNLIELEKLLLELRGRNIGKFNQIKEQIKPGEHKIRWKFKTAPLPHVKSVFCTDSLLPRLL